MDIFTLGTYFLYFAAAFVAFYFYNMRNRNYWKNLGIPYIKPKFLLGHLDISYSDKAFHEVDEMYYKKFKPIYGGFEGTKPYLFLGDPDLIRDIFIKDFHIFPTRRNMPFHDEVTQHMVSVVNGETWKRIRSTITPTFSSGKMRVVSHLIDDCAKTCAENFMKGCNEKSVDVKRLLGAFSMDVIASSAFGTKIDSHNDPNNPFVEKAAKVFGKDMTLKNLVSFIFPGIAKTIGNSFIDSKISSFFGNVVKSVLEERRNNKNTTKRIDFLQLMLEADKLQKDDSNEDGDKKGLSEIEILSQCILFFIAGYETTASTLGHTFYSLSQNPKYQEKLCEEVTAVLKETNNELSYDIIKKMPFLDAIVNETLRMYPPAIRTERLSNQEYTFANFPLTIPKGTLIGIPVYSIHRDPKWFPNPNEFKPERFLPENKDSIYPNSYMPFGLGPRNCVAMRFALLEVKMVLARVVSQFRFSFADDTKVPLEYFGTFGMLIPKDIRLKVEQR